MTDPDLYQSIPELLILIALLVVLFGAETLGWRIGRSSRGEADEAARAQVGSLQAAVLGLLALLLGFTFAMARHAVGDLSNIFDAPPRAPAVDRLDSGAASRLWEIARRSGLLTDQPAAASERLTAIRATYEPYLAALSEFLLMELPPWVARPGASDNWESTAWDFDSPISLFGPTSPFSRD